MFSLRGAEKFPPILKRVKYALVYSCKVQCGNMGIFGKNGANLGKILLYRKLERALMN